MNEPDIEDLLDRLIQYMPDENIEVIDDLIFYQISRINLLTIAERMFLLGQKHQTRIHRDQMLN